MEGFEEERKNAQVGNSSRGSYFMSWQEEFPSWQFAVISCSFLTESAYTPYSSWFFLWENPGQLQLLWDMSILYSWGWFCSLAKPGTLSSTFRQRVECWEHLCCPVLVREVIPCPRPSIQAGLHFGCISPYVCCSSREWH